MHKQTQIWSIYKITNKINGKSYIGQTKSYKHRWLAHKLAVKKNKPTQTIHFAIIKYGIDNFEFEVIASSKTQDDANWAETELIQQYESHISTGKGYNITMGGMNAPKTEEFKQMMRDWYASLSPEKRAERNKKHSEAILKQISENGHPAQGYKWTEESKIKLSISLKALDKEVIYTEAVRKNMSEAHMGKIIPDKQKQKISESIKKFWENKVDYSNIKCSAPGCDVVVKTTYRIIIGVRYCMKHGLRLLRNGILEKLPPFKYSESNPMPEEIRKKCGLANIGRVAHNRIIFTEQQVNMILRDTRSNRKIAKDFGVTEKVIKRIKNGNY